LWESNGTAAGTFEVTGISGALTTPGTIGLNPSTLTAVIPPVGGGQPPTLTNVAPNASFTEGGTSATLSPSLAVNDPNSSTLVSAMVKISGGTFSGDGDALMFSTAGTGIAGSYDSTTETLTLTGTDTLAHYDQVLGLGRVQQHEPQPLQLRVRPDP